MGVTPWVHDAVSHRVSEFAAQLASVNDTSIAVPNLDWTVAQLAQHVACLPGFWRVQHEGGDSFVRPENFAAFSDSARAHITETDAGRLAELITTEFAGFVSDMRETDSQRWLYGRATTTTNMCGLAVNELVLHGRDLAAVTGAPPPTYTRDEANAAVDAMLITTPDFVDADKARLQPDGVYHVKFRGGRHYTWTKHGTTLTIDEGRPTRPDAHLNADPAMFLMTSLNRVGPVRAGLSGKMVAYGRRPWRFFGLGTIATDGV